MREIGQKIEQLGEAFRGLWKSVILIDVKDDYIEDGWSVTFICQGQYVETPYRETAEEALNDAIEKLEAAADA